MRHETVKPTAGDIITWLEPNSHRFLTSKIINLLWAIRPELCSVMHGEARTKRMK